MKSEESQDAKKTITEQLTEFISQVAIVFASYAILLFIGQIFYWLYQGKWLELPFSLSFVETPVSERLPIGLIPYGAIEWEWLSNPKSWIGLHKIVYDTLNIHFSIAIVIIAFTVATIINAIVTIFSDFVSTLNLRIEKKQSYLYSFYGTLGLLTLIGTYLLLANNPSFVPLFAIAIIVLAGYVLLNKFLSKKIPYISAGEVLGIVYFGFLFVVSLSFVSVIYTILFILFYLGVCTFFVRNRRKNYLDLITMSKAARSD